MLAGTAGAMMFHHCFISSLISYTDYHNCMSAKEVALIVVPGAGGATLDVLRIVQPVKPGLLPCCQGY